MLALCTLALTLVPLQTSPDEGEPDLEQIAASLRTFGFDIDLEAVTVETADEDDVLADLIAQQDLLQGPEAFEILYELMRGLGLGSEDSPQDLKESAAKDFANMVAAYYQPDRDALVMLGESENPLSKILPRDFLIAHELVHSWRDQTSDLVEALRRGQPTVEEMRIRLCMSEGEAQLAALAWMLERSGGDLKDLDADSFESPLDQLLAGPYALIYSMGSRYAWWRWEQGGWNGVRGMWADPPRSTEQILHREKLGIDEPRAVQLPDWPLADVSATLEHESCLGELMIYSLLTGITPVDFDPARRAAAGWDGDRIRVYRTDAGDRLVVWRTVWDRPQDATEFASLLSGEGDGLLVLHQNVVDWVRSTDGALAQRLLPELHTERVVCASVQKDVETTRAVEASWDAELGTTPFEDRGRWVHPKGGFHFPIPDGWSTAEMRGMHALMPGAGDAGRANILVVGVPNMMGDDLESFEEQTREQLEGMGVEVESSERLELAGKRVLRLTSRFTQPKELVSRMVAWVEPGEVMLVTATFAVENREELQPLVDTFFAGMEFGVAGFERPEEEFDEDFYGLRDGPSAITEHDVVVRRIGDGEVLSGLDVWVVPNRELRSMRPDRDSSPNEEIARKRGRRFTTDSRGAIRVALQGYPECSLFARTGDLSGSIDLERLDEEEDRTWLTDWEEDFDDEDSEDAHELWLTPERELEVRTVDAGGKSLKDVPVGLYVRGRPERGVVGIQETRGLRGRANWVHYLNQLVPLDEGDEAWVTFGFPVADPKLINVWPETPPTEATSFEVPETGSVLVRFAWRGEEPPDAFDLPWDGLYRKHGDPDAPTFWFDREIDELTVHLPRVETGLRLELEPIDLGWTRLVFDGPTAPGEEIEVVVPLAPDEDD